MKLDDSVKFEAETLRTMALVSGTPFGTVCLQLITFGLPIDLWLILRIVVAAFSLWCFNHLMCSAYSKANILIQEGK